MKGVGADIVEIARIGRSLRRGPEFAQTVFSAEERRFCEAQPSPDQHYAARFAAKEAFLKAVGRGVLDLPLSEIEVVREPGGPPTLRLGPVAAAALSATGARSPMVSLSHDGGMALAFVVLA